ncbi:MAG: phage holin family protein, partial [Pseudomonadota bacterium]
QAGVGKIAAGGILLLVALLVVANALVDALAGLLGTVDPSHGKTGWAAVIVSGVFGAIGALLVRSGTADLAPGNLKPDRTALQMRRDKRLAEDQVR